MAANARDILSADWMGRSADELSLDVLMAVETKLCLIIPKQRVLARVHGVTSGTILLLEIVSVSPEIAHLGMRNMTRRALIERIESRHPRRIADVLSVRIINVRCATRMAACAGNTGIACLDLRCEPMNGRSQRNIKTVVAAEACRVIRFDRL
jgi:hypothetical protein